MKNILLILALFASSFFMLPIKDAKAECIVQTGVNQVGLVDANWPSSFKFGAFVNAFSKSSSTDCQHFLTQVDPAGGNVMSGEISQIGETFSESLVDINTFLLPVEARYNSIATIENFSVSSSAFKRYRKLANGKTSAQVVDLVLVHNPNGKPLEETKIPFEYCSELSSGLSDGGATGSNQTILGYGDFTYLYETDFAAEAIVFDGGALNEIIHANVGKICRTGHIRMFGKYLYFSLGLTASTIGNLGAESETQSDGTKRNIAIRDGKIDASFSWELPSDLECQSASGVFPKCDGVMFDLQVTQAVFQKIEPIQLVHERTAAIVIHKDPTESMEFTITENGTGNEIFKTNHYFFDPGEKPNQFIFYCNEVVNYCNMKDGKSYEFKVVNNKDITIERKKEIEVVRSNMLELFFVPIYLDFCRNSLIGADALNACGLGQPVIEKLAEDSNVFVRNTFPISDNGLSFVPDIENDSLGNSLKINSAFLGGKSFKSPFSGTIALLNKERRKHRKGAQFNKGMGFVPTGTFEHVFGKPNTKGGISTTIFWTYEAALVEVSGGANSVAHELGHLFDLPVVGDEEYEYKIVDNTPNIGIPKASQDISGFNVYEKKDVMGRLNFMTLNIGQCPEGIACDKGLSGNDLYWVNTPTWNHLVNEFTNNGKDPELLNVSFILSKSGAVTLEHWFEVEGFPLNEQPDGIHVIQTVSEDNNVINNFRFKPDFRVIFEPTGVEELDNMLVVAELPFDTSIDRVVYRNEFGDIIFSIDPFRKISKDYIDIILDACAVENTHKNQITLLSDQIDTDFLNETLSFSTISKYENMIASISALDSSSCQFGGTPFASIPDLVDVFKSLIEKLKIREDGLTSIALKGDLDNDGDVDREDLNILMASRNQPASSADDPKDLDDDGMITGLDARILTQLCTRPRCAVE